MKKKRDFLSAECNKGNVGKWSAKMDYSAVPHLSNAEKERSARERDGRRRADEGEMERRGKPEGDGT